MYPFRLELPPPASILRGGLNRRRFAARLGKAFAKIPVFGGLAPTRDLWVSITEAPAAWSFQDVTSTWSVDEADASWRFDNTNTAWIIEEADPAWPFSDPNPKG